ncbi:hypothetical protein TSMEX_000464 [Taenia solium]|eukprot:TsM_000926300 transcript=TsM_000926300 gene=TsM_000926300
MDLCWLGTDFCISDEVSRGERAFTTRKRSTRPGAFLVATSSPGRKVSEAILILRPMSILNGEPPLDAWTVALHARRAHPRLKFRSSGCASSGNLQQSCQGVIGSFYLSVALWRP